MKPAKHVLKLRSELPYGIVTDLDGHHFCNALSSLYSDGENSVDDYTETKRLPT
jgi:hypothetical protein